MYRKMFNGVICLMLLGGTFFVPKARADESDKKTIMTVNEPIQVPGKILPAGTYAVISSSRQESRLPSGE
jgi:hypothetical protein